jgi:hypothetical protein
VLSATPARSAIWAIVGGLMSLIKTILARLPADFLTTIGGSVMFSKRFAKRFEG